MLKFSIKLLILNTIQVFSQNLDTGIYQENSLFNLEYDNNNNELKCPENWKNYGQYCYKFIKSPRRPYEDSRTLCKAYTGDQLERSTTTTTTSGSSDLVSISTIDEHSFLIQQLNFYDPQHRFSWYIGAHQTKPQFYTNPDNTQLPQMDNAFFHSTTPQFGSPPRDFLSYKFSKQLMHWGLEPVVGNDFLPFICKVHITAIQRLKADERDYTYGAQINDPDRIPRGPYFIKQPENVIFDTSKKNTVNSVTLSCFAGGYPIPTYKWYREVFQRDTLITREIDPLQDPRYTVSGGNFIIFDPQQKQDRANYLCQATNQFGTVLSESVSLDFGFMLEFVMRRSPQMGELNWGKAIYCDQPMHFPAVRYSWSRNNFPHFVEEDHRIFISNDGALYFSALETIDRANYSCSIQSDVSFSGRNGPLFPLKVIPHSNYQTLKFPNSFPKAFPDTPIAGKELRLECVAFGYPVPSYNWTRKDGVPFSQNSYFTSYNRVLVIRKVRVEDEGEYICTAYNDRTSISNSIVLNIQAEPNFTIPLNDKHMDKNGRLIWTCEAFGIPDINYTFFKDGKQLSMYELDAEDRGRINIKDNVLTINYLNDKRDPGMYQCRAANTLKTRYSSAQLRVLSFSPSFKKHPLEAETYAAVDGNVTIKCAPEAAPRPKFRWLKDGTEIGTGGHRRIFENGNLLLTSVSRDDEALYTCIASNELGVAESKGRLIVLKGPRMVENPNPNMVIINGYPIDLQCLASIDEILDVAYMWTHNGLKIRTLDVLQSNDRIRIDGGYLRIDNATFSDAGDYDCIVQTAVGTISYRSHVIVQGPPGPPGGVDVISIKKNTFIIQWTDGATHGMPIFSYTINGRTNWNRTWVDLAKRVRAREIDRYIGRKEAEVEVALTPWSHYEFRVVAWNELGFGPYSAPSPRYHTLQDRPKRAPANIGGGGGKIGDLTITWTALRAEEQHAPGIHYKVFWKRYLDQIEFESALLKDFGNVAKAVVPIDAQNYYTEYVVKVQALNDVGAGPISAEAIIFSAEDMPQIAPQHVIAFPFNSTALNVSWNAVEQTREKIKGKLIGHRIKYWKKDGKEEDSVYYLSRNTRAWTLIVGLQPDTYYCIKVMAYNGAGEGPESEKNIERTFRKAPQKPPTSVNVYGINPSTVLVKWRYVQPSLEEEPLQGYKIRVWEMDQDLSTANDTIIQFGRPLEGYVGNLTPGKTYRMRVLAYSNGGDGRMSSPEYIFQMGKPELYRNNAQNPSQLISFILIISFSIIIKFLR